MARRGAGEGSIYQRADGRWVGAVQLGLDVTGGRQRREVADRLKAMLTEQQRGALLPANRLTVGNYLQTWLRDVLPMTAAPTTILIRRNRLTTHVIPAIGAIRLDRLRTADIQRLFSALATSGKLSPSGIRMVRSSLSVALAHAVRTRLIATSPMDGVVTPKVLPREMSIWTVEEARRFIDTARTDRLEAYWMIALSLGLRRGEVAALRLTDVDLVRGTISVRQSLSQTEFGTVTGPLKTRASARTIMLPPSLRPPIERQLQRRAADQLAAGRRWTETGLLFTMLRGGPLNYASVHVQFKALLYEAGVPLIRLHDLRHTCASMLLAQGVPARSIMDLLGHTQISTTMNLYAHVMPELQRQTADIIDRLFGSGEPVEKPD